MVAPNDVFAEILAWSESRPAWQRDALRRCATGAVTPRDLDEVVLLCKSAAGLAEPATPTILSKKDLATRGTGAEATVLLTLTHHRGANALAADQTISFGPQLTIIYGQNAAGKSGYARILKQACRSRSRENIFGNLLSNTAPVRLQATITFRHGSNASPIEWTVDSPPSEALAAVSVFDSGCAPIYLRDTDVAFRPFHLDIFDRLAALCGEVRKRLENDKAKLNALAPTLPTLPEGTKSRNLLDRLSSLTSPDAVRALATLSETEQLRLDELRSHQRDLHAADPKRRARELNAKAERLSLLSRHAAGLFAIFRGSSLADLRSLTDALRVTQASLAELRINTLTSDLIPRTGEETWRRMWDAAELFSAEANPKSSFPALENGARCPFCQQEIGKEAATRLRHFAEYIASTAQARVRAAESTHANALSKVNEAVVTRPDIDLAINELRSENPLLAKKVETFLHEAEQTQRGIQEALAQGIGFLAGLKTSPDVELQTSAESLRARARQLLSDKLTMSPAITTELRELEARVTLGEHATIILDEVERKKHLAAYDQCIRATSTTAITRKSTELTTRLVTDQLRARFQQEVKGLEFNDLAVEIQAAGGTKGTLSHRLVFSNAPGVTITHVLSEGESRTLSLASFLTELQTAISRSTIIFDDPVSSLDHVWRGRIARRLVAEAAKRQVIVFTHDILFYRFLSDEAEKNGVASKEQYIRRDYQIGMCSEELPSIAMKTSNRLKSLRRLWQAADTSFRTSPEKYYAAAREIYQLLRDTWEQAIPEILLADVVQRYRHSIETKKVRYLHDITPEDCRAIDEGMTECSRWLHDQPPADATPIPKPEVIKRRIDDLESWVKTVRKRRE